MAPKTTLVIAENFLVFLGDLAANLHDQEKPHTASRWLTSFVQSTTTSQHFQAALKYSKSNHWDAARKQLTLAVAVKDNPSPVDEAHHDVAVLATYLLKLGIEGSQIRDAIDSEQEQGKELSDMSADQIMRFVSYWRALEALDEEVDHSEMISLLQGLPENKKLESLIDPALDYFVVYRQMLNAVRKRIEDEMLHKLSKSIEGESELSNPDNAKLFKLLLMASGSEVDSEVNKKLEALVEDNKLSIRGLSQDYPEDIVWLQARERKHKELTVLKQRRPHIELIHEYQVKLLNLQKQVRKLGKIYEQNFGKVNPEVSKLINELTSMLLDAAIKFSQLNNPSVEPGFTEQQTKSNADVAVLRYAAKCALVDDKVKMDVLAQRNPQIKKLHALHRDFDDLQPDITKRMIQLKASRTGILGRTRTPSPTTQRELARLEGLVLELGTHTTEISERVGKAQNHLQPLDSDLTQFMKDKRTVLEALREAVQPPEQKKAGHISPSRKR